MRTRLAIILALVVFFVPVAAHAAGSPARLSAVVGEDITISLNSNPTTGYQWTLAKAPAAAVTIDKGTFEGSASPELAGAPGRQVFHVKAKSKGTATLQFQYARSFEKGVPPVRTFTVVIAVKPQTSATQTSAQVFWCEPKDEFQVVLPSNPSTGYQWALLARSFDGSVLMPRGARYKGGSNLPGAPGQMTFGFRALAVGTTTATMTYERKGVQPARVNTTMVVVEK